MFSTQNSLLHSLVLMLIPLCVFSQVLSRCVIHCLNLSAESFMLSIPLPLGLKPRLTADNTTLTWPQSRTWPVIMTSARSSWEGATGLDCVKSPGNGVVVDRSLWWTLGGTKAQAEGTARPYPRLGTGLSSTVLQHCIPSPATVVSF